MVINLKTILPDSKVSSLPSEKTYLQEESAKEIRFSHTGRGCLYNWKQKSLELDTLFETVPARPV